MKKIRIYHRKSHHKRGVKIAELNEDVTFSECLEYLKENTPYIQKDGYFRVYVKDNRTVIDYGSHHSNIVIHKPFSFQ